MPVGSSAYLSTENLNLPKHRARKLAPKYIGPFRIAEAHPEKSTYTLELSPELRKRRIHPVFHASRLRPHLPNDDNKFPGRQAPKYYDFGTDSDTEFFVDKIIDHNWVKGKLELRVLWELGDNTWEPLEECKDLIALDDYLELQGVDKPAKLTKRPGTSKA